MDTQIIKKIEEILKIYKDNDDFELEFKYDTEVSNEHFYKLIDFYKKQKLKINESNTLDIIFDYKKNSYRITIDNNHIDKYSSTNLITKDMIKEILIKEQISDYKPLLIKDYNLKLNLKKEKLIDDTDLIDSLLTILPNSLKGFRYKKRTSFISNFYRIDLTIVNNYNNANPKLFTSNKVFSKNNILSQDTYEIEIEAIKSKYLSAQSFFTLGINLHDFINQPHKSPENPIENPIDSPIDKSKKRLKWVLPNRIGYNENIFNTFRPELYDKQVKATCECDADKCDISNKSISLFPQQRLIKDYMEFNTPYRGAFLYHELGSGKSGASIAASEGYINKKKMFVLSPASLAVNYEYEILKISSIGLNLKKDWKLLKVVKTNPDVAKILLDKYAIDKSFIKKDGLIWIPLYDNDIPNATIIKSVPNEEDKSLISSTISHIIRNRYTFISYNGLTKKLITSLGKSPFDNSFVIIDEVHNFSSRIVNGSVLARDIYTKLMSAVDCKLILLSGTPIINNPYEIATIINLIRGYMNVYELSYNKVSKFLTDDDFINNLKASNLLYFIDEFTIDNENRKILLSLLPKGYRKDKIESSHIIKENWKFTENKLIESIIESLNKLKEIKISIKSSIIPFSALPNTRDEFNSYFLDNTDDENPKVKNQDLFMRRILGTLSYYSISGSELFPRRLPDITRYLYMTDIQFKKYADVRTVERKMDNAKKGKGGIFDDKSSVYRAFSRMVCNFTFPEDIERVYPNDIKRAIKKEIDDEDGDNTQNTNKSDGKVADIYELQLKKAINELLDISNDYMSYENVKSHFSPKFAYMYDDIINCQGSVLVYSQFRTVEGLGLFTEFIKYNGFKEVDIKKMADGDYEFTDKDVFNPVYDNKRYVIFNQDREKTRYLMNLFNGDYSNLPKGLIKSLPDDKNQLYGKLVKLFCITASGAEGISLKNVRAVLIMEPYWNNIRINQVIGRAIRSCSHESLPLEDRTVVVYRYLMKFTKKQIDNDYTIATLDKGISTDEHISIMAEKKMAIINQFLQLLKSSALDCLTNAKQNKPLQNSFKCYSWALGVNNDELSYTDNIKNDMKIMKHKNYQILKKDKGRVFIKNGKKYVELNQKVYNYHAYVNAGILIPDKI